MSREDRIRRIAAKHGFDVDATEFLAQTIQQAGGRFAQWKHPGLGGFGQWMPGMTTLSPRAPELEKRLDELCLELSALLHESRPDDPTWWPKTLGLQPDSAGGENRVRYAYFADSRRVAVDRGDGRVTVYDTGEHRIEGISRTPNAAGQRLVLRCQGGAVELDSLTVVEPPGS